MTRIKIDVDLIDYIDEFDDDDLIEELEERGYAIVDEDEFYSKTEVTDLMSKVERIQMEGSLLQFNELKSFVNNLYKEL